MSASSSTDPAASADDFNPFWKRNLVVCIFGSFSTIVGMTLLLPFLPVYVEQLGIHGHADIARWSGIAYGAAFLSAALVAPLWGRLADRYGRKLMMIRASLGMAVAMSLIGLAENIWQLVALRLLTGLLGGYASGSTILVATQTPKARVGWALGVLASGIMAGNLVGPLIGGLLPQIIGIRDTFWVASAISFIAFLGTTFLIKEEAVAKKVARRKTPGGWKALPDKGPVIAMLGTGLLLLFANMSIEPIITLYVGQLTNDPVHVTFIAGLAMSAAALGSILSASQLGKLADRVGAWRVIIVCMAVAAVLLIPQAFVTAAWQLVGLRFLMGLALGGLLPCVASVIRSSVPDRIAGGVLGYSTSAQYSGQVLGPLTGGFLAGWFGMRSVFIGTALLMACGVAYNMWMRARSQQRSALHAASAATAAATPAGTVGTTAE